MNTKFWVGFWGFFKAVLIIAALIIIGVGISFFFFGPFTIRAYSERLTYAGIGTIIVAGFSVVSALGSYRTLGTPNVFTAQSDARIAHERIGEYIRTNAKRYSHVLRLFAVAAICIALGAWIEILSR